MPDEYFRKVGYEPLEDYTLCAQGTSVVTGKIRTDALGQRVRERFNEELTYEPEKLSTTSSKRLRLNKNLGYDQKSTTSSGFRVRSIHASSRARAMSQASGSRKAPMQ